MSELLLEQRYTTGISFRKGLVVLCLVVAVALVMDCPTRSTSTLRRGGHTAPSWLSFLRSSQLVATPDEDAELQTMIKVVRQHEQFWLRIDHITQGYRWRVAIGILHVAVAAFVVLSVTFPFGCLVALLLHLVGLFQFVVVEAQIFMNDYSQRNPNRSPDSIVNHQLLFHEENWKIFVWSFGVSVCIAVCAVVALVQLRPVFLGYNRRGQRLYEGSSLLQSRSMRKH